jgi:uncharacterized membrane protein
MEKKIVGVFDTEATASRAIENLKVQGIGIEHISVITKDRDDLKHIEEETGSKALEGLATGAATGGVIGGVAGLLAGVGILAIPGIGPILAAGPILTTLTGLAVGAGTGGLVGVLVGLGLSEDEAGEYEAYVNDGKILVLVDSSERGTDVHNVFLDNSSLNASRYNTESMNTQPNRPII